MDNGNVRLGFSVVEDKEEEGIVVDVDAAVFVSEYYIHRSSSRAEIKNQ